MYRTDGVQRLADLLETLRGEKFTSHSGQSCSVTFTAGVAQYPEDATELDGLYRVARAALRSGKAAGREHVVRVDWQQETAEPPYTCDIVLIDDDEALAEMLLHSFRTRGYSVRWLHDGTSAVELLAGTSPELTARLAILDVNLPELNGMAVLRRLADDQILRRTKVIMLTARSAEAEVVAALQMGAFDHVAKPFSLPILMRRVHRALES